jgi:tRNA nucleotidyltransferase (CCA-adding enzyme)
LLVSEFHSHIHRAFELKPSTVLALFNQADAWRKPERFEQLLVTCKADARGRTGFENDAYQQADYIRGALNAANRVEVKSIVAAGYQGAQIKQQLDQHKIAKIKEYMLQHQR